MSWLLVRFPDVVHINPRGKTSEALPLNTEVSFVPMASISEQSATIVDHQVRHLAEVRSGYTCFRERDIIFAKITPCMENGKVALACHLKNGLGFGSTEFHVFRTKAEHLVLPEFLYHFLRQNSLRQAAKQRMMGAAGQQRVPEHFFEDQRIPLPPLSEQHRIVEILDQADAMRRRRAEADSKATRIQPALFFKMFGEPSAWKTEGKTLPLADLVDIHSGATPSKVKPDYWGGEVPWVSPKDMKKDFIGDTEDHITQLALDETTTRLVPEHSILIVVRGMILARQVPIAINTRPVAINQDMKALTVKDDRLSPLYLFSAMKALEHSLHSSVSIAAHGTRKLETQHLLSQSILLPSEGQHRDFVGEFEQARGVIDRCNIVGPVIDRLFQLLIHRAFTGDLTAMWREAHMKELLTEMEHQQSYLEMTK